MCSLHHGVRSATHCTKILINRGHVRHTVRLSQRRLRKVPSFGKCKNVTEEPHTSVFTVLSQRKATDYSQTVPLYQIRVRYVPKIRPSWLTEMDGLSSVQLHFTVTLWQHPACVSVDVREIKSLRQCTSYLFRQWTCSTGLNFSARVYIQSVHFRPSIKHSQM
jgi:hypothetical protein